MKTIRLLCALVLLMITGICHAQQEYETLEDKGRTFCIMTYSTTLDGKYLFDNGAFVKFNVIASNSSETVLQFQFRGLDESMQADFVALKNIAKRVAAKDKIISVEISLKNRKDYNYIGTVTEFPIDEVESLDIIVAFYLERMTAQGGSAPVGTKILEELCRSDIQSITIEGHKIDVSKLHTAPTIKSMLKTLAERVPGRFSPKDDVQEGQRGQKKEYSKNQNYLGAKTSYWDDTHLVAEDGEGMMSIEEYKSMNEHFLDFTSTNEGVVKLPSGLQYKVLRQGSGRKPNGSSVVTIRYETRLVEAKVVDSNMEAGQPRSVKLDRLIKGVTEGLQLMNEGAKYRLFIPYNLAYGERGNQSVPPYSTIIFDVELIKVE